MKTRSNFFTARLACCPTLGAALVYTFGLLTSSGVTVSLTPGDINGNDTTTASFTNDDVVFTPLQGSTPITFNGNDLRLGTDDFATNQNAFNDPDTDPNNGNEEKLQMEFSATSGLTQLTWDFSRADGPGPNDGVIISGFVADPLATLDGAVANSSVSYADGVLNLQLGGADFGNPDGILNLASPAASAGQTLTLVVTDTTLANAQLAITGISYEDDVQVSPPVIATGLAATGNIILDTEATLSVTLQPGALPIPTYLWEFDDGSGFVTVSADEQYVFPVTSDSEGTYRVTVTNSEGSDTSSGVFTVLDDGDSLNNQWELDNFGDITTQTESDDAEPDNFNNGEEFAAGTDPNNPDTDGDGLNDGDEAAAGANPLLLDTDGDGFSDGYEVNVSGTNANDAADSPAMSDGRNSIGITFSSVRGRNPNVNLPANVFAGATGFVQNNWNATGALAAVGTFSEADVVTPNAGVLVDSSGAATSASFVTDVDATTWSVISNPQRPVGGLLSGYIFVSPNDTFRAFDFNNIPYSRYDIVVYMVTQEGLANERGFVGVSSFSNFDLFEQFTFTAAPRVVNGAEPVWTTTFDTSDNAVAGSFENFPRAATAIFRGLSESAPTVELSFLVGNVGVAAIQIVEAPDTDGDGMGDAYETSVGLDPNDNGSSDPEREGASGDFDGDGIDNITEHNNGTDPTQTDTDGDGADDNVETDTGSYVDIDNRGSDPRIQDSDGDGLFDGPETGTGTFVDLTNTGTSPVEDGDTDADAFGDAFEVLNNTPETPFDPFNNEIPGGPNPNGFAIAFDAIAGAGNGPLVEFPDTVFVGAPGVEQKNWNRTIDLANNATDSMGGVAQIASPVGGSVVDSSGAVIGDGTTGVDITFAGGSGTFSFQNNAATPYQRLFNSFIFGNFTDAGSPDSTVTISNIPYATYDAYVYIGSETNNRTGQVTSNSAGTTLSFTTGANANLASGLGGDFVETTDTGAGNPQANYAVFRNQTSPIFDVTTIVNTNQVSLGIFGVQIVEGGQGDAVLTLENPARSGNTFTADFTTDTAGNYILERNLTLDGDWINIGAAFAATPGTPVQVSDPDAPSGRAFYRVSAQ